MCDSFPRQVAEAAARRSDIAEALGACPQWPSWAASVLKPRNERDNLMHWACGRPSASDMHGMAEDSPAGVLVRSHFALILRSRNSRLRGNFPACLAWPRTALLACW